MATENTFSPAGELSEFARAASLIHAPDIKAMLYCIDYMTTLVNCDQGRLKRVPEILERTAEVILQVAPEHYATAAALKETAAEMRAHGLTWLEATVAVCGCFAPEYLAALERFETQPDWQSLRTELSNCPEIGGAPGWLVGGESLNQPRTKMPAGKSARRKRSLRRSMEL